MIQDIPIGGLVTIKGKRYKCHFNDDFHAIGCYQCAFCQDMDQECKTGLMCSGDERKDGFHTFFVEIKPEVIDLFEP